MRTFVALSTIPLEDKQNQAVPVLGYLSSQVIGAVAFSCRVGLLLASGSDSRRRWSGYVQGQCSQSATDGNCHFYDCTSCKVQVKLDFDHVFDKLFFSITLISPGYSHKSVQSRPVGSLFLSRQSSSQASLFRTAGKAHWKC